MKVGIFSRVRHHLDPCEVLQGLVAFYPESGFESLWIEAIALKNVKDNGVITYHNT
jgi:hypothetical protein